MPESLKIYDTCAMENARMIMGYSGWMDGSEVSTGTVEFMMESLGARLVAEIDPEKFYIYNFPGSMEYSALFRPHVVINDGLVRRIDEPSNRFYADEEHELIFMVGKEPNRNWREYAHCLFEFAQQFQVQTIYFVGSVAGLVPHTREPRLSCVVSDKKLKARMAQDNFKFASYEGPGSIVSYITQMAMGKGIAMINLLVEIPAYIHGRNPKGIEVITRRLGSMLGLNINLDEIRHFGEELEKKLDKAVAERQELAEHIKALEENYDKEVFDNDMGDLKVWLQQQGIRLD